LIYQENLFGNADEKAAFKAKYGYDLKPPGTTKELLDVATFFTRPDKGLWGYATGLMGKYAQHWLEHAFPSAGISVVDLKTMTCGFASGTGRDKAIEVTQFLHDLVWKYKVIPEECLKMGHAEMMESIKKAKYAMADDWWSDHWAVLNSPEYKAAIGPIGSAKSPLWTDSPQYKGGRISVWFLGISKTCKNPEAAWQFVKWFTNKNQLQTEAQKTGSSSGWINVDKESADNGWLPKGLAEAIPFTAPLSEGFLDQGPKIATAFSDAGDKMIHDADPTAPGRMVDALAKQINDIMSGK